MTPSDDRRTVWSSDSGRTCPDCGQPQADCRCRSGAAASAGTRQGGGRPLIALDRKGRRGKTVTVITGLSLPAGDLDDLARALKKRCGVGGTVRGGAIEIQGDQREAVAAVLQEWGLASDRGRG